MAALNEEQQMIKDQASAWVREQAPVSSFRAMRDQGDELAYFPETWKAMTEMGWTGLLVPEAYGGAGLGYQTFGLVLEQLGRNLVASPLFASALVGATALIRSGSEEQKQEILPKIAEGSRLVVLASDEGNRHNPEDQQSMAQSIPGGYRLQGEKRMVMEGMAATDFVVSARVAGESGVDAIGLFLVAADHSGVSRRATKTMDSRGYAAVTFDDVELTEAARLSRASGEVGALDGLLMAATASLTAEMLGTAAAAFDMTLDYLKTRKQFGQIIGGFQSLGHRAAGLYSEMELTRSCVEAALKAIDDDADNAAELVALAKCKTNLFLHEMSNQLIQIHGGIGMTDEFDAGFYLKRARVLEMAFGTASYHRDRYAALLEF